VYQKFFPDTGHCIDDEKSISKDNQPVHPRDMAVSTTWLSSDDLTVKGSRETRGKKRRNEN
jgi:hypothetical protein